MKRRVMLCVAVAAMFGLVNASQATDKNAPSPFLIAEGLPHLTKILMAQWDNPALKLTEEQKTKLLVVRKETMTAVKKISPKATKLRKQVIDGITAGKSPEELEPVVMELANLKASATLVHLKCIHDTRAILTPEQQGVLASL